MVYDQFIFSNEFYYEKPNIEQKSYARLRLEKL